MAGEVFRQIFQAGKESVEGTAVAATRKMYVKGSFSRQQAPNLIKVSTGTRDNQRDVKLRTVAAMGTVDSPISTDEMLEYLLATIAGGVTGTQLTAPSAPTISGSATNATTGGTIAAGVITLGYTVTNATGESPISPTGVTTTTTTGTSTVTTPAQSGLAGTVTLVKWYITAPAGALSTAVYAGSVVPSAGTAAAITITAPGTAGMTAPSSANTGAYRWVFKPSNTLDTHTYEWFDGYQPWQARGCKYDELHLTGDIKADTKMTGTWWARDISTSTDAPPFTALTGGLADRPVNYHQGYASQMYLDAFGATPGTTLVVGSLLQWDVTIKNNAARKYYGDNTTATGDVKLGELNVQGSFTIEGNATGLAEYANWRGTTKRIVRLVIGNAATDAVIGTSVLRPQTWIDIPGAWTAVDLTPEDEGTKAYKFTFDYVYDPTNAYGIQVTSTTSRSSVYA